MAAFEYRQAEEIRDVFAAFAVRYLFIGKSGAILLGFPVTQTATESGATWPVAIRRAVEERRTAWRGDPA